MSGPPAPPPAGAALRHPYEVVIEAGRPSLNYWVDLWRYRDLLGFLTLRDIKVRYKQTILGVGWALIQPVVTTVIFTFVFGKLAGMSAGGVPYPLLVLAGLLPWQLFTAALSGSSASLISNAQLISKVYFPRLMIPLASLGVALIDFLVVLGLYVCVSLWFGRVPSWHWALLPIFIGVALVLAFGAGLWFTALTVKYRDFRYIVPFIVQIGFYLSPVIYSSSVIEAKHPQLVWLYSLNPMAGVIDGFRWALLDGKGGLTLATFASSLAVTALFLLLGVWYFRKTERTFSDVI